MDAFHVDPPPPDASKIGHDLYLSDQELFSCLFPGSSGFPVIESGMIRIPSTLTGEIVNLSDARRGFPTKVDGQFVRMLYLSATTITTLGFGDIVPLTTPARLAISVEAVTGILLMGRFLNAVAKEK